MAIDIPEEYKKDLFANVANANMNLLLGAGFSYGAKDASGKDVLLSDDLKEELIDFAKLNVSRNRTLGQIYDAACNKKNLGTAKVNDFLKHKYINSKCSWQQIAPSFAWRRIFTLNIDDVLEDALKKCQNPLQGFKHYHFKDRFSSRAEDLDDVQVIHLHGSVRNANRGYIFGAKEYAVAQKEKLSWHICYADDFSLGNFLIIGSQMVEPDLDFYLAYRTNANLNKVYHKPNSFYISSDVDDVLINVMERNGIYCINSTAEEFFTWLDINVPNRKKVSQLKFEQTPKIAAYKSSISQKAYVRFCAQYRQILHTDVFIEPDTVLHDFFYGDSPDWWDIKVRNDANLNILDDVKTSLQSDSAPVLTVLGSAGCGKTTALMRTAFTFAELGWQVYYYNDESSIDVDSTCKVLKTTKGARVLVVVDNAADYVDQVDAILHRLDINNSKLDIKFLLAERQNRLARIVDALSYTHFMQHEMDWLNDADINKLIDKLTEKDKLRRIRGKQRKDQIKFFKSFSDKQLLIAMRELSGDGGKFDKIISDEYRKIGSDTAQRIYAMVCLCHSQKISIGIEVIHRAFETEIGIVDLLDLIENRELKKVVIIKNNRLLTRHSLIAQHILKADDIKDKLSNTLKANLLAMLMVSLSFYVNPSELSKGTPEARLVRIFMDFDHIQNVLRRDDRSLDTFFKTIRDYYDWNSKYWAQRGLFESTRKHFSDALDYVTHASNLDSHWTITNTKGVVFLRAASSDWLDDYEKARKYFDEGITLLDSVLVERGMQEPKGCEAILKYIYLFSKQWNKDMKEMGKLFDQYYKTAEDQRNTDSNYFSRIRYRRGNMLKLKLGI